MQTIENRLIPLKQVIKELAISDRWTLLKWLVELLQQEPQNMEKAKHDVNLDVVHKICQEFRNLPVLDNRSPDDIIGYNELGGLDS